MRLIRKTLLTFLAILFTTAIFFGQAAVDYKLRIILLDSIRHVPIEFATISVIPQGQTQAFKYALTDAAGKAEVSAIAAGVYTLKIEFMGYKTYLKSLTFGNERVVDLGKLYMEEQVNALDAVVVSAIGNPIIVKKDTIEYNATSFKTTDSDMLEDLLKKLPGIEVDKDGQITSNGKVITKIMVDGKLFFLNDPLLATKNLPSKIIDKVRVVERKSDQAQFTGIDDGNEETVIDLSIRPGMMNGWFGNMQAGYGTQDRYQAAGLAGNFTTKSQISFVGNANNTNNRGFSDIAGGMMGGMRGSMGGGGGGGGGGGVRVGGATMNFGGSGITTSWMAGLNANTESKNKKMKLGGSYVYSGSETASKGNSFKQNFLASGNNFNNSDTTSSFSRTEGHRANVNLEYFFNDKTSILFKPNVNVGYGSYNDSRQFSTDAVTGAKINNGNSHSYGNNQSQSTDGDFLFRQKLGKVGRTLSVNVTYSYSNNELDGNNYSKTDTYGTTPKTTIVDQQINIKTLAYSLAARASYTEPLGNNFYVEAAYMYRFRQNNSEKEAYNADNLGNYTLKDTKYSNIFENKFVNQQGELNLRKTGEKFNYVVGFNVQPSYTQSIDGVADTVYYSRSVINFAPSAMFEYNFSDSKFLRIRYRGQTNQPSVSQLQPVPDNSNPLYIAIGNPDLIPEFQHRFTMNYRNTKRETFRTLEGQLEGVYTINKIVNMTSYDSNGIRTSKPVNEQGVYNANGSFNYSTPIAKSKYFISSNTRAGFNKGVTYTDNVRNLTSSLTFREQLGFRYRGEKFEGGFSGTAAYSYAWYSIAQQTKPTTWTNTLNMNINLTLPAGINLVSDLDYKFYIGFGAGYNKSAAVWNAEVSKLAFKNMGTFRIKVYDILNQAKSISRTTTDNYIEDIQSNVLQQYFMFSFTYRFGKFGGQRSGGRDGGRGDWHGGGGHGPEGMHF